jgi:leader peptidase (prepilin peptidase)/N-methyltransferase
LDLPNVIYILFFFALGACVGSFLNVVVWRLPQVEPVEGDTVFHGFYRGWKALSWPPSHCPKCDKHLKWYDNLPVIGWLQLGGRCRFCKEPISIRYPIVEAITGLLFVFYYLMFFIVGLGPCTHYLAPDRVMHFVSTELVITDHWPIYLLDMMLIAALLAASLIDAELFIIPQGIPWFIIAFALIEHAVFDRPCWPGALNPSVPGAALAAGAAVGLLISFALSWSGILPRSFSKGGPLLEVDKARLAEKGETPEDAPQYTPKEIRAEMRKEMLFLLPPLALGMISLFMAWKMESVERFWAGILSHGWISGLLGSILGLLVGGFVVWFTRIAGSIGFGREAMGMGDVDLMAAVGAVLGPGPATVAFFLAPFFGILLVIYMLIARKGRELPYGPYLSLATAFVMLFYCPIADYLSPGITGVGEMISHLWSGG